MRQKPGTQHKDTPPPSLWTFWGLMIAAIAVIVLLLHVPDWVVVDAEALTAKDWSEVFRNYALILVGLGGGVFVAWRNLIMDKQQKTAERGQVTDRYNTAIEHLAHDTPSIRIGGLYALQQIGLEATDPYGPIVQDVVQNFIKRSPYAASAAALDSLNPPPDPRPCPDLHVAADVLQKVHQACENHQTVHAAPINLSRAILSDLDMEGINFTGVDLSRAIMTRSKMSSANLSFANLFMADLRLADLRLVTMKRAELFRANMTRADMKAANIQEADLFLAEMREADLQSANTQEANMQRTNIQEANMQRADLHRTYMGAANVSSVNFEDARNLTQDQLDTTWAWAERLPRNMPDGLTFPDKNLCPIVYRRSEHPDMRPTEWLREHFDPFEEFLNTQFFNE